MSRVWLKLAEYILIIPFIIGSLIYHYVNK